jgi:hypothetical protein
VEFPQNNFRVVRVGYQSLGWEFAAPDGALYMRPVPPLNGSSQ